MHRLLVPIDLVRVKPKKLRRLHPSKVRQYERDYECGDEFPPIEVENCGTFYTIRDGRHRYIAQKNLGYPMIDVIVVRGDAGVTCGFDPGTPAFILRNFLQQTLSQSSATHPALGISVMIKAWKSYSLYSR